MQSNTEIKKDKTIGSDMTQGNILPIMIRFAVPLLLTNLIQNLYSTVDMMIVGRVLGSAGTVAVSSGSLFSTLMNCIGIAYGSVAQIYSAQMCGADMREEIGKLAYTVYNAMMITAAVVLLLSLIISPVFLILLNCPEESYHQAVGYMRIMSFGFPFLFGYNVMSGVLRGMGDSKRPLIFITISAVLNLGLDVIFVIFLHWGTGGSAAATVISQVMTLLMVLSYIHKSKAREVFQPSLNRKCLDRYYLKASTRLAIPIFLQYGCIHLSQLICNSWVNSFGLLAAAVTNVGNKIAQLIGIIATSISNAAGAVIAQNLGAKKYDRVRKTVYAALAMSFVICIFEISISLAFPEQLFSMFLSDGEVIALGRTFLKINVITYILNGIQGPYTAVVTGSGNTRLSLCYGLLDGFVLRLGVSYLLAFRNGMGVVGYWYGNALAHLGPVVIAVVYFYGRKWEHRQLLNRNRSR